MATDDGFLSRWARRKAQARQGAPLPDQQPVPVAVLDPPPRPVVAPIDAPVRAGDDVPAPRPPPPTLDDVANWPVDAPDFSRFVAQGVQPDVKNAALKKLFTDPHFNVMDGLDIYIDDYGKPDPLPASMLRQMVQGRFLGLFDDDDDERLAEKAAQAGPAAEAAPDRPTHNPDNPLPADTPCSPDPLPNENADLRLQPHDAAGRPGDPARAGEEPGCPH